MHGCRISIYVIPDVVFAICFQTLIHFSKSIFSSALLKIRILWLNIDISLSIRPCIHRLFPCVVCPCSLVTRHTDINEPLFCLVVVLICCTHLAKQRFIVCVVRDKATAYEYRALYTPLEHQIRRKHWVLNFIHSPLHVLQR